MLDRPPSDRYLPKTTTDSEAAAKLDAALVPGAIALGGVIAFVVIGGILAVTAGLVVLAASVGWLLGRFVSPPTRATLLAIATIALGFLGIWLFGRMEGGVLDPMAYLDAVEGLGVVVLSLLAGGGLAAAASQ